MDRQEFSTLIGSIYDAAYGTCTWQSVLNALADTIGAHEAWMVITLNDLDMNTVIAPRADPETVRAYQEYWWKHDITYDTTTVSGLQRPTSLIDIGPEKFFSSKFYNEFWRDTEQAAERFAANLVLQDRNMSSVGIQPSRKTEEFDRDVVKRFSAFLSHLQRAVQIQGKLRQMEMEKDVFTFAAKRGIALLDTDARIIFIDDTAKTLLEGHHAVSIKGGYVNVLESKRKNRFEQILEGIASVRFALPRAGKMDIYGLAGKPSLELELLPYKREVFAWGPEATLYPKPLAVLLVHDPQETMRSKLQLLSMEWGLTDAEAKVALELYSGDKRDDVAKRLGIAPSTLRTHMMRIYEKASVNRRGNLIAKMNALGF